MSTTPQVPAPAPSVGQFAGDYQFAQALAELGQAPPIREAGDLDAAQLHATLAVAAYMRELAAAIRAQIAEPRIPLPQLAELIGDVFASASRHG